MKRLWKLDPQTIDDVHFEARLRGDVETLRRSCCRVAQLAIAATERVAPRLVAP